MLGKTPDPFVSFAGNIALCHVICKGKGINQQMAPEAAAQNIPNLLISAIDSGSLHHITLLAAYEKFDSYLDEAGITHPVVLLSDDYSSQFDLDILIFLKEKNIYLFVYNAT